MKVLLDVDHSFAWAHGGVQVLVEHLLAHLPPAGVEVEPVRWWDPAQTGDIIHTFYKPSGQLAIAKQKGYAIVSNVFLDYMSSNGAVELAAKEWLTTIVKRILPNYAMDLGWRYGDLCDATIYPSEHEARIGQRVFGADVRKSHVILHGVDRDYLSARTTAPRESPYLVTVGTIHPRKNTVLLATLAHELRIPIVFVGKPYSDDDYFREFSSLVDEKYVVFRDFVSEAQKIELLGAARGFVTLSKVESGCIAVLEALSAGCPLFLPDLPWARAVYDGYAVFGTLDSNTTLVRQLGTFYRNPQQEGAPFPIQTWADVAREYVAVYDSVLGRRAMRTPRSSSSRTETCHRG